MGALPKEERLFTYNDYVEWDLAEGERYEVIYGEAYAMAAPGARHQEILMALANQFYNFLQGKTCKVYPAPYDVRLFYKEDGSDDTVVQPDISIVCEEKKRGTEGCRGAPDLIIEILSPSNTVFEMEQKLRLYRQAGVKEYWIVNPKNNGLTVYLLRNNEIITETYEKTSIVPVALFPELKISLEQIFT